MPFRLLAMLRFKVGFSMPESVGSISRDSIDTPHGQAFLGKPFSAGGRTQSQQGGEERVHARESASST